MEDGRVLPEGMIPKLSRNVIMHFYNTQIILYFKEKREVNT